jgi:hypothetical protein
VGNLAAVNAMIAVGWPLEVKAAWQATALNIAVIRGDAAMAEVLLKAGADWRTEHGFKDNVVGTLAWASLHGPEGAGAPGDLLGCARVLVEGGVPLAEFQRLEYSEEVSQYLHVRTVIEKGGSG